MTHQELSEEGKGPWAQAGDLVPAKLAAGVSIVLCALGLGLNPLTASVSPDGNEGGTISRALHLKRCILNSHA